MKKSVLTLVVLFMTSHLYGQDDKLLTIPTEKGDIKIQPILHATMAIYFDGKVIYTDPYGGAEVFENIPAPDLVLITDIHGDHMNAETLKALDIGNTAIVAPQAVADEIGADFPSVFVIGNGETTQMLGISIEAIPMYNLPEDETSRHTKGRGNGYILNLGGKRIYISGDTEDIPEMRALKNIDVAFICMNLPYTMDVGAAASATLDFKPKIVYPYHYRGQDGLADVKKYKELVTGVNSKIEVRLLNWYPEK